MVGDLDKVSMMLGSIEAEMKSVVNSLSALHSRQDRFDREQVRREDFIELRTTIVQHIQQDEKIHSVDNVAEAKQQDQLDHLEKKVENISSLAKKIVIGSGSLAGAVSLLLAGAFKYMGMRGS